MKTKFLFATSLALSGFLIFNVITAFQPKKPWVVPAKYLSMKNAAPSNAESVKNGKELYMKNCQSCHGKSGHGDGTKAAQLKTEPGDFSQVDVQKQPDGALFYKISEGREDMPSFKKKIPDEEDTWSLVNYIRTLNK
ncbi:MAG: c-type cytochrome [Bacteroidota bacterium]|nr:c-type cytochrome [Bacteroidota bacterium]